MRREGEALPSAGGPSVQAICEDLTEVERNRNIWMKSRSGRTSNKHQSSKQEVCGMKLETAGMAGWLV